MATRLVFAFSLGLVGAFIAAGVVWFATWEIVPVGAAALALAPIFALLGLALGGRTPRRSEEPVTTEYPFWLG